MQDGQAPFSIREAKKVAHKRETREFTSLTDAESIEGLAKVSLKRIKDYINRQQYTKVEFSGMPSASSPRQRDTRNAVELPSRSRKKQDPNNEVSVETLFPERELVS